MKKLHKLTEKDLQFVVDNWQDMKAKDIAEHIGVTEASVTSYAGILRKLGVEVPRKTNTGNRETFKLFAEKWLSKNKNAKTN